MTQEPPQQQEPVVEPQQEPPQEPVVDQPQEPPQQEPVTDQPPQQEPVVEPPQEPPQQEPVVDQPQEPTQEPVVDQPQEPVVDPPQEPTQEPVTEPQEPVTQQDPEQNATTAVSLVDELLAPTPTPPPREDTGSDYEEELGGPPCFDDEWLNEGDEFVFHLCCRKPATHDVALGLFHLVKYVRTEDDEHEFVGTGVTVHLAFKTKRFHVTCHGDEYSVYRSPDHEWVCNTNNTLLSAEVFLHRLLTHCNVEMPQTQPQGRGFFMAKIRYTNPPSPDNEFLTEIKETHVRGDEWSNTYSAWYQFPHGTIETLPDGYKLGDYVRVRTHESPGFVMLGDALFLRIQGDAHVRYANTPMPHSELVKLEWHPTSS